jgi:histone-lysine N-methyltransferase SETMAR
MEWRKPGEKRPRKAKVTQSAKKIMATIFWDAEGILLIDYKERNTTVNAEYYAQLLNQLRQKIKEKRRGKLSLGVRLLHDNAPVHTAVVAKAAVKDSGFTEVAHPPYSPDLAPSDYFLFSKLKSDLRGRKFSTDEEIHAAVEAHFASKDKSYFLEGIELLVKRCKKCIEVKGDYIEK